MRVHAVQLSKHKAFRPNPSGGHYANLCINVLLFGIIAPPPPSSSSLQFDVRYRWSIDRSELALRQKRLCTREEGNSGAHKLQITLDLFPPPAAEENIGSAQNWLAVWADVVYAWFGIDFLPKTNVPTYIYKGSSTIDRKCALDSSDARIRPWMNEADWFIRAELS